MRKAGNMKAARGMGGSGYARARFTEELQKARVKSGDMIEIKHFSTSTHATYIDKDPNDLHSHWMLLSGESEPKRKDGASCDFIRIVSRLADAIG